MTTDRFMTMLATDDQFVANVLTVPAAARGGKDIIRLIAVVRIEIPGEQIATGTYNGNGAGGGQAIAVGFQPIHVEIFDDFADFAGRGFFKNDQMPAGTAFVVAVGAVGQGPGLVTLTATGFTADGNANLVGRGYDWTAWGSVASLAFTAQNVIGNGEPNSQALLANQFRLNAGARNQVARGGALSNTRWMYAIVFETDDTSAHAVN